MATQHELPYYAPSELLPAPLPSVAEIRASKRISMPHETPVVRVGDHYAVKFGGRTSIQEGENMLFVQESTSVPIPKVYALFHDKATKMDFIVMEYVPGTDLRPVWGKLTMDQKQAIMAQLRKQMDELRSIPSPGYYGGIWKKPIQEFHFEDHRRLNQPHLEPAIAGPHSTEEQWTQAMCLALDKMAVAAPARHLAMFRRHYHAVFRGHKPVFTHANLFPGNVMLRQDGTPVIIDWEHAGWYPSFWEYCCAVVILRHEDDWNDLIYDMLSDQYPAELGWMSHHHDAMTVYN